MTETEMRFPAWIKGKPRGTMAKLMRVSGVDYSTLSRLNRGELLANYKKAQLLSDVIRRTFGDTVTVRELCEPEPHSNNPCDSDSRNSGACALKPDGTDG